MSFSDLPALNALLNSMAAICLLSGYAAIRRKRRGIHKRIMISALILSGLFLISYLVYHGQIGSVPYPHRDWTRGLYFSILIPHIILAAVMGPFICVAVWCALKDRIERHKKIVRWIYPVWLYVSVSGVVIYMMLYRL